MIRPESDVRECRKKINGLAVAAANDRDQLIMLIGMSTALQWVCSEEGGPGTVSMIMSGRPLARRPDEIRRAGPDPARVSLLLKSMAFALQSLLEVRTGITNELLSELLAEINETLAG